MPIDILICNVPGTLDYNPLSAPAILKSAVLLEGFSCRTLDFNIRLYDQYKNDKKGLDGLQSYFLDNNDSISVDYQSAADQLISNWADELVALDPTFVTFSVFTYQNKRGAYLLSQAVKQRRPDIKIVLGGQGLGAGGINGELAWPQKLKDTGIINYYIKSEGEVSLVKLLLGDIRYPGIDSSNYKQIEKLDDLALPNYDDYEFDLYPVKKLPIVGSRGCVRKCTFCDIHSHWKYRYRSGESIAEEMMTNFEKYGIHTFNFADSLTNGALKEFKKWTELIANYNKAQPEDKRISWHGQFIVRNSKQLDHSYWQNIKDSGAEWLGIGVETGSDRVRAHMEKGFNNDDLDYTVKTLAEYGLKCRFLMLVGYPTETVEDHNDTLNMLRRYRNYAMSVINWVEVGSTMSILPGTPVYLRAQELNIDLDMKHENNWIAWDNQENTLQERFRRREELIAVLHELGFPTDAYGEELQKAMMDDLTSKMQTFESRNKVRRKMFQIRALKPATQSS